MTQRPRSLYRSPGWAYVTDGVEAFDVRESDYRAKGYNTNSRRGRLFEPSDGAAIERKIII